MNAQLLFEDAPKPLTRVPPEPSGYVRRTSIAAYHAIMEGDLVGERQQECYAVVYDHGPITSGDAYRKLEEIKGKLHYDANTRARFTELRGMGLLVEIGTGISKSTGRECILWDVTENLPVKPEKKPTLKKRHEAALQLIEELKEKLRKYGEII